jgi:RNA polymerase sigma-70 factor (ECF subfamily)
LTQAPGSEPDDARTQTDPAHSDLDAMFRSYASHVAAIGMRLLGRRDEADDLVQDVFVAAIRGLHRLHDPESIKGWLSIVAVRSARRRLRIRRVRHWFGFDEMPGYELIAASEADPAHRVLIAKLYRVLDTLSVNERIAWTLRFIEGESLEDVARLAGCSLATAKRRIAAATAVIEEEMRGE